MPSDKRKQSLYFPVEMLDEIRREAAHQDRSVSWIVQQAWKSSRGKIMRTPGVNDMPASVESSQDVELSGSSGQTTGERQEQPVPERLASNPGPDTQNSGDIPGVVEPQEVEGEAREQRRPDGVRGSDDFR